MPCEKHKDIPILYTLTLHADEELNVTVCADEMAPAILRHGGHVTQLYLTMGIGSALDRLTDSIAESIIAWADANGLSKEIAYADRVIQARRN
jgi:hypothetical protein